MANPTAQSLISYYKSLLILQYLNKTKASGTVGALAGAAILPQSSIQVITFPLAPTSGTFVLNYDALGSTAAINWNDSAGTIQTKLQAVSGLSAVIVTGSIASQSLTITNTSQLIYLLSISANSLVNGATSIAPVVTTQQSSTDTTLPFSVLNGFNLTGSNIAIGKQLDIIGEYIGVSRSAFSFLGTSITLSDADFLTLIQIAIIQNNGLSSLYNIQALLHTYFPGEVLVFDYQNMQMSYLISSAIGSQNLIQVLVTEGLLPAPMGVQVAWPIYAAIITTFFGFRTYLLAASNSSPFNTYSSYQTNRPWLSYANGVKFL